MGRNLASLDPTAASSLCEHHWPGNVRELDNVIQRALILQTGNRISANDLHLGSAAIPLQGGTMPLPELESVVTEEDETDLAEGLLGKDLKQHEYQLIVEALRATSGSRKDAAEKLGISPRTLRYKLARMREEGIDLESLLAGK
jgi:two-component system response regulator FlrC